MKNFLLAPLLILNFCAHSMESSVEHHGEKATQTILIDPLPHGWRLDEIAKAASQPPLAPTSAALPKDTHVLAWKRIEDNRPFLVENCLVLCRLPEKNGHYRWYLADVYRHPREPSKEWTLSWIQAMTKKGCIHIVHRRGYDNRPTNKEIYQFMDDIGWVLGVDKEWKLLGGAVYKTTWETMVKEKPTRDFKK